MTPELLLPGCQPEPLSSYLKGLGVLSLAGEQLDRRIRAAWRPGGMALVGVELEMLLRFLIEDYRPTPLVAPWNGGSGFGPKDQHAGIDAVERSTGERLAPYRHAIATARRLHQRGLSKEDLIEACRAQLPDEAVAWIDAAVVLVDGDVRYPPILGTGGNLGRLELSNNFMQRLAEVLALAGGRTAAALQRSDRWLRAALLGTGNPPLLSKPVGQFDPGSAGGTNSSPLGDADSLVNPWDFILLLEGALLFASAAARRMAGPGAAGLPFMVSATSAGYATGAAEERPRGELWVPLWERPATAVELANLLGEGRAQWRGRQASSGLDLARAARSLGVDRGVSGFVRYVFAQRFGQSNLAVPAGRVRVDESPQVPVLSQLDAWVDRLGRPSNPPAAVASAARRVDAALMAVALEGGARRLQDALVAIAEAEMAVGNAGAFRERASIAPVNGPLARDWLPRLDDGSVELRLAAALASQHEWLVFQGQRRLVSPRTLLRPLVSDTAGRPRWSGRPAPVTGLGHAGLPRVLAGALHERALEVQAGAQPPRPEGGDDRGWTAQRARDEVAGPPTSPGASGPLPGGQAPGPTSAPSHSEPASEPATGVAGVPVAYRSRLPAPVEDVIALLTGDVDEARLERLLTALLLLDWRSMPQPPGHPPPDELPPSPALSLLAPFFHGRGLACGHATVRLEPGATWPAQLAAGQVATVAGDALRRLRAARLRPLVGRPDLIAYGVDGPRLAAALLCPISRSAAGRLLSRVATSPQEDEHANPDQHAPAPV